jgi:hypothetical protein
MAPGPSALLMLAVLTAHLLLLDQPALREAPRLPQLRSLAIRVVNEAPTSAPAPAAAVAPRPEWGSAMPEHVQTALRVTPRLPATVQMPAIVATATIASSTSSTLSTPDAETETARAIASAASPSMAFAIPASLRLLYTVTGVARGQEWTVPGELLWRHDGSQYQASLAFSAPGGHGRTQQSTGRLTADGLEPKRFSEKGRAEQATHFERESGALVFSSNAPAQALLAGTQDRLSVLLQLASMVGGAPGRFPAGTVVTLHTAGTRDATPWLFTVEGDEPLELPGGSVLARKLTRQPQREYDTRLELWLGISMDYVPVRIRLTQPNGDFVDQQWASTDRL